jgi:hypothetical protein
MDDMQSVMTENSNGTKRWRLPDSSLHREDGPAIEFSNGKKSWRVNGRRHRTDGPALEYPDGNAQWWLHDRHYTFDEWLDRTTGLTDEEKVMMKLKYG